MMDRDEALKRLPQLAGAIESSAMISARPGQCRDLEKIAREIRTVWATLRVDTTSKSE